MLGMFIFVAVIMTITAGVFFGLMFTSGMKSGWKKTVFTIIIAMLIGCGISGGLCLEHMGDVANWNNGHCACGNEWTFTNAEHTRNGSDLYYYYCDDCGEIIRLHSEFKKGG